MNMFSHIPQLLYGFAFVLMLSACGGKDAQSEESQNTQLLTHANQTDVLNFIEAFTPNAVSSEYQMRFPELISELQDKRAVLVGEAHDQYGHHLIQLAILKALHAKNPDIAIGLEWFQQPFQSVLDDYLAGRINETELLKRSEYYDRWRFDYRVLRPIMQYAKDHQIPVIALNAQVELTRKIGAHGLESLSPEERAQLPETIHPAGEDYRVHLQQVFAHHDQEDTDGSRFERFMTVQRVWDETMAMNAGNYLQAHPKAQMVVFAGMGHVSHDRGIPNDLARTLGRDNIATVLPSALRDIEPGVADYFVLTEKDLVLPPTGKLGVWLDNRDNGVYIGQVVPDSAAEKAGLLADDRLLILDGTGIGGMADLMLALARYAPEQAVNLTIERDGKLLGFPINLQ